MKKRKPRTKQKGTKRTPPTNITLSLDSPDRVEALGVTSPDEVAVEETKKWSEINQL